MVIVMKPSWKSPDEGLGYCPVGARAASRERIREPGSHCGAGPWDRGHWGVSGAAGMERWNGDGMGMERGTPQQQSHRVAAGGERLGGQNKVLSLSAGGWVCSRPGWARCPLGPEVTPGRWHRGGDTREVTPGLPALLRPSLRVSPACSCSGARRRCGCWSQNGCWKGVPSAGAPIPVKAPCVHIPPGTGYRLLRRCNQAANQLGKLTAGVSYFLRLATKPVCVNSVFPRSPGLLRLIYTHTHTYIIFFPQRRKGHNNEKAEEFLVTVSMLCNAKIISPSVGWFWWSFKSC